MERGRLRTAFLTKDLSDEQLAELIVAGEEVQFTDGDVVFVENEPADFLWIFLGGQLELTRRVGDSAVTVATMTNPGQWAGGLRAWGDASNSAGYRATGTVVGEAVIFRVPSTELARLVERWFPFGKHIISGIYGTVRSIEATARQRESLMALGSMAAGLAHELNNPASASLRAVESLRTTCDEMLVALTNLAEHTISAAQFIALDGMRRELMARPAPEGGTVAVMDREDALGNWLERHHVDQPWQLAPTLAAAAADPEWLQDVEQLMGAENLNAAITWLATTVTIKGLMADLTDTTNRISNLVGAVKTYSQMDRAAKERAALRPGIESTLAMLAPKLRTVEVTLDVADDVPEVDAYQAELNQVWTNLVDNAVDAMDGHGTLAITVRRDGDGVAVDIADDGPGIPEAVQQRMFEPFFSTKDVGKGTGLGLDISRRIVVERHGGDITFASSPAGTTATVHLPLGK